MKTGRACCSPQTIVMLVPDLAVDECECQRMQPWAYAAWVVRGEPAAGAAPLGNLAGNRSAPRRLAPMPRRTNAHHHPPEARLG